MITTLRWRPAWMNLRLLGPASRLALGQVCLMVVLLLLSDLFFSGFLSRSTDQALRERRLLVQALASDVVLALQSKDARSVDRALGSALARESTMRSAAVVLLDGLRVSSGPHAERWRLPAEARSSADNMRVLLSAAGEHRGELQVSFEPVSPASLAGLLGQPMVQGIALMVGVGFVAFQLYLRRAMVSLDPRRVVPDRVRAALDTLTEGILVLDPQETVVLANRALLDRLPPGEPLVGRPIESLPWLVDAVARLGATAPWRAALRLDQPRLGTRLQVVLGGAVHHLILNCSPIHAGPGGVRGCLLTLADVTELEERTERLRIAMAQLEASKDEIRKKNEELVLLATRDPLTGCLNRRAFLADSATLMQSAARDGQPLSCLMCDIDHFKQVNDTHGHASGDLVLQAVAATLGRGLRPGDLLARFGGEEFCILLADADAGQASDIAERLRAAIEVQAGRAFDRCKDIPVTMSFGLVQFDPRQDDLTASIDRADRALYRSKTGGRNRVTVCTGVDAAR